MLTESINVSFGVKSNDDGIEFIEGEKLIG